MRLLLALLPAGTKRFLETDEYEGSEAYAMQTMLQDNKQLGSSPDDTGTSAGKKKLVIVGSPAGSIEALSAFVGTLPTNFPAPILLAWHCAPHHPSTLRLILQEYTFLPVHEIIGQTPLRAGAIYVVPPGYVVTLHEGSAEVQKSQAQCPQPLVDLLLSSAAKAYGDRVIAVIAAESGSDGANGAVEVKRVGGMVIVLHPQAARIPSLPSNVPPTLVDFQVDLADLGPLLCGLLTGAPSPSDSQPDDLLGRIMASLPSQAGIDARRYTTATLLHHVGSRMVVTGTPTMRAYLHYLQATPAEAEALETALLDPVTSFFDDPDLFAFLKSTVLPEVVARARARDRTIRCWTVGCETGEEAYSLAMLITDLLGAELAQWQVRIFATDLDEEALSFARRGWYAESLLTGLPDRYRERFFEHTANGYRIARSLRHLVTFSKHDLNQDAPFSHMDLILCRNVLSRLTAAAQEAILNQMTFSLFPSGYLVLGNPDQVHLPQAGYARVSTDGKVSRCIGRVSATAQHPWRATERQAPQYPAPVEERTQPSKQYVPLPVFEPGQTQSVYELVLRALPIGLVVIDRAYHVLTANGIARRLLGMRTAPGEGDFFHISHGIPYHAVRNAIEDAFRERDAVTLPEVELEAQALGNARYVTFTVAPIFMQAPLTELAVISLSESTEQVETRHHLEALQAELSLLVTHLGTANQRLHEVNAARLSAEQALHSANEAMALTQQEFQSRLEEWETTNEELQIDLEELETTNAELRAMLEALKAPKQAEKETGGEAAP